LEASRVLYGANGLVTDNNAVAKLVAEIFGSLCKPRLAGERDTPQRHFELFWLQRHPDFKAQKSLVQEAIGAAGHIWSNDIL
jgi:hypothetical protein